MVHLLVLTCLTDSLTFVLFGVRIRLPYKYPSSKEYQKHIKYWIYTFSESQITFSSVQFNERNGTNDVTNKKSSIASWFSNFCLFPSIPHLYFRNRSYCVSTSKLFNRLLAFSAEVSDIWIPSGMIIF